MSMAFWGEKLLVHRPGCGKVVFGLVWLATASTGIAQQPCDDNSDCNDGASCTVDQCFIDGQGVCVHQDLCENAFICDGTDRCCTQPGGCGTVAFGACIAGTPLVCDPGLYCSEQLGRCVECTLDSECVDGDVCTQDDCRPNGTCDNPPLTDTPCDDGDPCTSPDLCAVGVCGGAAVDCQTTAPPCHSGSCEPTTGECVFVAAPDGTACNDGEACTAVDECASGICVGHGHDGCIRLEFRLPAANECSPGSGLYCYRVGDVVEVGVYAVGDGCPAPPSTVCGGVRQPLGGVQLPFSWDPRFLALADPAVVGEPNPEDPCNDIEPCNANCGLPDVHNWAGSSFPKDCAGDRLNEPCPTGFPQNDGDALYLAFVHSNCGGGPAAPACASASGLHVTTLKFRAIKASAGISLFTFLSPEPCLGGTLSSVAGPTGEPLLGEIGPPAGLIISCVDIGDCPAGRQCVNGSCLFCSANPPVAEPSLVAKNRFLSFQGGNPGRQTAARVRFVSLPGAFSAWNGRTFWARAPQDVCELGGFGPAEGCLPGAPTSKFSELTCSGSFYTDWSNLGTIHLHHAGIVPGGVYEIQMVDQVCPLNELSFSAPLPVGTGRFGDIVGRYDLVARSWTPPDNVVDVVTDVVAHLEKFANIGGAPSKARTDVTPYEPDLKVDIIDVTKTLDAFRSQPYPFSPSTNPCAVDGS